MAAECFKDVPEEFFHHVSKSLENGIQQGMLLEIKYKSDPDTFWIASITMVCGPLLRVRYIGSETDFWCDLAKMEVHPLGWCRHYEGIIEPPEDISDLHEDNIVTLMKNVVTGGTTVPNESLISNGAPAIERIKFGMKLEVQNEKDPYKYWLASVAENIGGRLLLHYDAPADVFEGFWLFYTDPRLRHVGFVQSKGFPYVLHHPENSQNVTFDEEDWQACLTTSLEESAEYPFPNEILSEISKPLFHRFEVGMKLEALDPSHMSDICPATVTTVFDHFYFTVVLDDYVNDCNNDGAFWLCRIDNPYIFPIGWAKSHGVNIVPPIDWNKKRGFDWTEYLNEKSAISAPRQYFKKHVEATEMGYKVGMKLEVVDPLNTTNLCSATILKITQNLLYILIESTKNKHWFSCDGLNIFPSGWSASNNYPLEKSDNNVTAVDKIASLPLQTKSKEEWCDKIFFNYKCYSGPYISRNKLSQLPKSVGPGPLCLVIKEVLNMIISVAYKPAKLLKDWELEGKVEPGKKIEILKAKLKTSTYHANVVVIMKNDEIEPFCKEMCTKLQACPHLFGPKEFNDLCPERCMQVDKSKFHNVLSNDKRGRPKGSISKSSVPKCWNTTKKRKKRGLHFMTIRARERRAALETTGNKDGPESGNESDGSPNSTPQPSEAGTRPNSPDSNSDTANKKRRKKREPRTNIPPLEMKTRGAKLPNFAIQMKEGHWNKKDVQTIYNNTCVVPKKTFLEDSDSEGDSYTSNSLEIKNDDISDVSDSEEPELKKLRVTPLHEPLPTQTKMFPCSNNGSVSNASISSSQNKSTLPSNPRDWSIDDVYSYLTKYDECREIAEKLKEQEVDGAAFVMLNFPTMCQHLNMRMKPALNLCKHVATLKWSFISRYVNCDG